MDLRSLDIANLPEDLRNRLTSATPKDQVIEVLGVRDEEPVADVGANIERITGLKTGQTQRPTRPAPDQAVNPVLTTPRLPVPISEDDEDDPAQAQTYLVTLQFTTRADPTELCQVRLRRYTEEEPRVLLVYRL